MRIIEIIFEKNWNLIGIIIIPIFKIGIKNIYKLYYNLIPIFSNLKKLECHKLEFH